MLENRSREYVEQRIRAGVLEQGTADLLVAAGVGERLRREGIVHHGVELQFDAERHRIPLSELTGGRSIVIYGQTEVVKDLIAARIETGAPLLFEVDEVAVEAIDTERPRIRFTRAGAHEELECDVIAGCDGFHGVCRPATPRARFAPTSATIPTAGSASSRRSRPPTTSSSTRATSEASRSSAFARPSSPASTSSAAPTRTSPSGRTTASGTSGRRGSASTAGRSRRGRCSRRA